MYSLRVKFLFEGLLLVETLTYYLLSRKCSILVVTGLEMGVSRFLVGVVSCSVICVESRL